MCPEEDMSDLISNNTPHLANLSLCVLFSCLEFTKMNKPEPVFLYITYSESQLSSPTALQIEHHWELHLISQCFLRGDSTIS